MSELLLSGAAPSEQREPQHSSRCLGLGNYSCLPFHALEQQELSVQAAAAGCDQQSGPRIAPGPDRAHSQNSWDGRNFAEGERSHWKFWLSGRDTRAPKASCPEELSTGLSSSCSHTSQGGSPASGRLLGPLWAGGCWWVLPPQERLWKGSECFQCIVVPLNSIFILATEQEQPQSWKAGCKPS